VLVDQELCIGCRLCMAACPYNARYFNYWEQPKPPSPFENPMPEYPVPQQQGTVGKCVFCVHYTDKGRCRPASRPAGWTRYTSPTWKRA
jgi:molybdopterin-containing oxidoreductase family iron-sulfur binding subunit